MKLFQSPKLTAILAIASLAMIYGCDNDSSSSSEDHTCSSNAPLCGDVCCPYECIDNVCVSPGGSTTPDPQTEDECTKNGQTFCSGKCVSLQSDPMHCGDCTTICAGEESCQDGKCVVGCGEGLTLVGNGLCVDPNSDSEHCGADDTACGEAMYCDQGQCKCMDKRYDCDGKIDNGCESEVKCEYLCEEGKKTCGLNFCCAESESCCGTTCCAEGTTCCGGTTCFDLQSDPHHCGSCKEECKSSEKCEAGACVDNSSAKCDTEGQISCWGTCIDVMNDAQNCGSCAHVCDEGLVCKAGECTLDCAEGQIVCSIDLIPQCVEAQSDPLHCGDCNTQCAPNQMCTQYDDAETGEKLTGCKLTIEIPGKEDFSCEEDKTECWGNCIDKLTDVKNCGECGNICDEGLSCIEGVCQIECPEDLHACGTECADFNTSPKHCGNCETACATNQICADGACTDATLSCENEEINKDLCWGTCVDLQTDTKNCGTCGNACENEKICVSGACIDKPEPGECSAGQKMCFGACKDILSDVNNCGDCLNQCGENHTCTAGKCEPICTESQIKCDGACFDPKTSTKHCGACNKACGAGMECREVEGGTGACQCDAGHFDCDGNPANGCESTSECACAPNTTQNCWRGTPETRGKGICKDGQQECDASGKFWGPCEGGTYPSAITCNDAGIYYGDDRNCNGIDDKQEGCKSKCDLMVSDMSYIGCEYWAVYTENEVPTNHTVVFSNPSSTDMAEINIYNASGYNQASPKALKTIQLAPNEVTSYTLSTSSSNMLSSSGITSNSYRIRSSIPITAYQFNPWSAAEAHSNDASLMLPQNVLSNNYRVLNWHVVPYSGGGNEFASNVTIIATEPGTTTINVSSSAPIQGGNGVAQMKSGDTKQFTLNQFQVLNLKSNTASADQTGSVISSDKKLAIYSGTRCSFIPDSDWACDHLEEQLFPTQTWGKEYYAVRSYPRGNAGDYWKIVANEDNTVVTVPDSLGGSFTLNAGQYKKFETTASFEIKATKPISVGQFLTGKDHSNAGTGDPAFVLAVPYEQYRNDYAFLVPSTYSANYISITKPKSSTVYLDGKAVTTSFTAIPNTNFEYGYVSVSVGTHHMSSNVGFGLVGYGFLGYTSYGYPIGLDLKDLKNTN